MLWMLGEYVLLMIYIEDAQMLLASQRFLDQMRCHLISQYWLLYFLFTSDRQKIADEKNLARMGKEMERTEDQEKTTEEELAKIQVINNAIRGKLAREEETCVREEEQLKVSGGCAVRGTAQGGWVVCSKGNSSRRVGMCADRGNCWSWVEICAAGGDS